MSVIVSIHQPNSDLMQMFDTIYVLAKGGVCLYSGLPLNLRQHLNECHIDCNQNQVPIEVLLRISSEHKNNEFYQKLFLKQNENSIDTKMYEHMRLVYGKQNISKRFSFKDTYNLLM